MQHSQARLTRKCPLHQCGKAISSEYFACPYHWRKVGDKHKRAILLAWDRYKKATNNQDGLAALRALEAAQQAALEETR